MALRPEPGGSPRGTGVRRNPRPRYSHGSVPCPDHRKRCARTGSIYLGGHHGGFFLSGGAASAAPAGAEGLFVTVRGSPSTCRALQLHEDTGVHAESCLSPRGFGLRWGKGKYCQPPVVTAQPTTTARYGGTGRVLSHSPSYEQPVTTADGSVAAFVGATASAVIALPEATCRVAAVAISVAEG